MKNYLRITPLTALSKLMLIVVVPFFLIPNSYAQQPTLAPVVNLLLSDSDEPPVIDGTDDEFTPIKPSPDSRVIYVSNSSGSDSNDCLSESTECKTIARGIGLMRAGFPDHVLLKRGDRWRIGKRELDGLKSGRSTTEKGVLAYYGMSGARPIIEGDDEAYRYDRTGTELKHFSFIGLHFYAYKRDPSHPEFDVYRRAANGVTILKDKNGKNLPSGVPSLRFIGGQDDILLEDNKFEFSDMTVQANTRENTQPSRFTIRRNIFAGVYHPESSYFRSGRTSHIFAYWVDGLDIRQNVFDYGGWYPGIKAAGANQLSHSVYLQWRSNGDKTFFVNNISTRAASHGVQMRAGGLAKDNFFARNAIGLLMGYNFSGREVPSGVRAHAIDNVIMEASSMYKGIEACKGPENVCTGAIWGLDMNVLSDADYQAHGNIITRLAPNNNEPSFRTFNHRSLKVSYGNGRNNYPNSNNISFKWDNPTQGLGPNYLDPNRTLGSYNETLGGANSFDAFMQTVVNRPLGTWDERYEAESINSYIREGFTTR